LETHSGSQKLRNVKNLAKNATVKNASGGAQAKNYEKATNPWKKDKETLTVKNHEIGQGHLPPRK